MKENRKLVILALVCLVLALSWFVGIFTSPRAQAARLQSTPLFDGFSAETADSLRIDAHSFSREAGQWSMAGLPARGDRVDDFLLAVEDSKLLRKVTSQASQLDRYGLDSGREVELTLADGDKLEFLLGGIVEGSEQVYAAVLGDDEIEEVFTLDSSIDFYLRQSASYWTDLRLFPERPESSEIIQIAVTTPNEDFVLLRSLGENDEEIWIFEDDAVTIVDSLKANGMVNTVLRVESREIERYEDRAGEASDVITLASDSKEYMLQVFETQAEDRTILLSGETDAYQYIVSDAVRDRLLRDKAYFSQEEEE